MNASDALAVALVMFPTYKKRRQARTLVGWALILNVLENMEMTEEGEGEDGDSPRVKRTRQKPAHVDRISRKCRGL